MTAPPIPEPDFDLEADDEAIEEEIRQRERMMLRWPLLLGTAAVLYGALMIIYVIIRLLSVLYIYSLSVDIPPSPLLLASQFFPIVTGVLLGAVLFLAGIITLRRRLLGPRLINLWSIAMLAAILGTLFLRLNTLSDFVDRQAEVYERARALEQAMAETREQSAEDPQVVRAPGVEAPSGMLPPLDSEQLAVDSSRLFVAFAIMGACGPGMFALVLNLPRIRRTWICWD